MPSERVDSELGNCRLRHYEKIWQTSYKFEDGLYHLCNYGDIGNIGMAMALGWLWRWVYMALSHQTSIRLHITLLHDEGW